MTPLRVLYSFNKTGFEADYWTREIRAASNETAIFIPFNHGDFLQVGRYLRAQLLDNRFYARDADLLRLYGALEAKLAEHGANVLLVDNVFPYHPEFLRKLAVYKVLRTTDGPMAAYDRDFAYLHAYDHVLYHCPAYSRDLDMAEKLAYCGARRADFWPLALFDAAFDPAKTEEALFASRRDIDVIFVGALYPDKMPLLARVKKAFGRRFRMHGLATFKKNLYFNAKYGAPGWIRPIAFSQYVPLYQRSCIGINIHLRGEYTVGSYRMFDLPGNGVMQISDGGRHLERFFRLGCEIATFDDADDLVSRIDHYLTRPSDARDMAIAGYRRVMKDHRFRHRMAQAAELIAAGIRPLAAASEVSP
jgi:spore maturation protein CgeB